MSQSFDENYDNAQKKN